MAVADDAALAEEQGSEPKRRRILVSERERNIKVTKVEAELPFKVTQWRDACVQHGISSARASRLYNEVIDMIGVGLARAEASENVALVALLSNYNDSMRNHKEDALNYDLDYAKGTVNPKLIRARKA